MILYNKFTTISPTLICVYIHFKLDWEHEMKIAALLTLTILLSSSIYAKGIWKQWAYKKFDGDKISKIWNKKNGEAVVVAVIDTGVDYNHPDLAQQMWVNEAELNGVPGVDDDNNGYIDDIRGYNFAEQNNNPMDTEGHGTHVAGIIGASHNNFGISGVNPNAKIMALKAFSARKGDALDSAHAIRYAVDNGAKIINCSWIERKVIPELEKAVEYAIANDVVIVGGAGNAGINIDKRTLYLADYDDVIIVGSIDEVGKPSKKSNYGREKVDILAPGDRIYSTTPNNSYGYKTGTSMATPFVTGAISLLMSVDPNVAPHSIKQRLFKSGVKRSQYKVASKKRINVYHFIMNTVPKKKFW